MQNKFLLSVTGMFYGLVIALMASCSGDVATEKKTVEKKDTVAKARWINPGRGKIYDKTNIVQIPLTALENHILGPVRSVSYKEYKVAEKDGAKTLDDSGYNVYDKAGHLVDQNEFKDGKPRWKCVYKYNDNGQAAEWDFHFYYRKDSEKINFQYDGSGKKTGQVTISSKKEDSRRLEYKYDDKGNEIEEAEYYGDKKKPWTTTYKYDGKGNQTEYVHRDETGRVLVKMTCSYNTNGDKTSGAYYNDDTTVIGKWTAGVDDLGRITERVGYGKDGTVKNKVSLKYDGWDNITEYTTYKPDGTVDTAGFNALTEYEYDSHGNTIKETSYKIKAGKKIMTDVAERKYEYY